MEIFENDLPTFDGSPAEARRIAGELGLAIAAPASTIAPPTPPERSTP